jgi:hypothetical protein
VWSQAFASTTGNSVLAPGLTFGPLLTEGNRAVAARIIGNPGPAGAARSLGSPIGGLGSTVWISFLTDANTENAALALTSGGSLQASAGTASGGTNYELILGAGVTGGSSQSIPVSPPLVPNGSSHLIALKFALTSAGTANNVTMYVNPDSTSLGGAGPTGGSVASYASALPFMFDSVTLQNAATAFNAVGFDEIRIGSTWASVTPVPEPASILLLLGPAAWAWRRRISAR